MISFNTQIDFHIDKNPAGLIINDSIFDKSDIAPRHVHLHPFYEIHLIINGKYKLESELSTMYAGEGDLLLIPPDLLHCVTPHPPTALHRRSSFWISISHPDRKEKGFILNTLTGVKAITKLSGIARASDIFFEIRRELIQRSPCYEDYITHTVSMFLIDICRQIQNEAENMTSKGHNNLMVSIEEYIGIHSISHCTLDKLSQELNMSPRHLSRIVCTLYKKNFRQLLLEKRMQDANWLIEEFDIAFDEIASKVGYSSVTAFYHAYRCFYGHTPAEYRSRIRMQ